MTIDSIDTIKRRMIRNACKIWGFNDIQDINSFDPVLALLIGALAEELHNISNEINKTDARVVEKMLELLFNQHSFSHTPAHAIAYAKPLQSNVIINQFYQFYFNKPVSSNEGKNGAPDKKNIYFTPTANFTLINGEVKYLLTGKTLFELDGNYKEILAEIKRKALPNYSKLLIGIKLDSLVDKLDGLSLFFSFKNIKEEDRFYQSLHSAKWKINGNEVPFKKGLEIDLKKTDNTLFEKIKKENNISYKSCRFINDLYSKKFITLSLENCQLSDLKMADNEPHILTEYLEDEKLPVFNKEIAWIEVELTQPVSSEEINDLIISMNCFPIINRELNEYTHSIVKGTNIIPLVSDKLFFDIEQVSDSKDSVYVPKTSVETENKTKHSYLIRQGGITRFDTRDAKQTINHLIGLIRDEAAAFSIRGTDLISSELKQLDQIVSRLKQRIDTSEIGNELNSYLIVDSDVNYDKLFVSFWTLAGSMANNIRPGTKLSVQKGIDIDDKSLQLVTHTAGGRQEMTKEDKLNTLRRALLSKGKVVTVEDIKTLCFVLFGENLDSVDVKKGVVLDLTPGKGMSRSIDITLLLGNNNNLSEQDVKHKIEELKMMLIQNSINLLPYRIFVK